MSNLTERNAASIIRALGGNQETGKCRCPVKGHGKGLGDRDPSLRVSELHGVVLVKCHAGCTQDAVINRLREMGVWPDGKSGQKRPHADLPDDAQAERLERARDILRPAIRHKDRSQRENALVERYFAGRGNLPAPSCARLLKSGSSRELTGIPFPAIAFPVVNCDNGTIGVTLTWLAKDGSEKLNAEHNRKFFGPISGGFVRLGKIDPNGPLIIAEGIETALSAAHLTGLPAISALSATNMPKVVPPKCGEVIIGADNDKPGIDAATALARNLLRRGFDTVRIAVPDREGDDWNDVLQSGVDAAEMRRAILEAPEFAMPKGLDGEALEARLNEIAKLTDYEYEPQRKALASELSWRATVLDAERKKRRELEVVDSAFLASTEPWPTSVDGDELLGDLRDTVLTYVKMGKRSATAVALWIFHAHAHEAATHSPILAISSATKRSGKTSLLRLLSGLVPKALSAANVTPAVVFRAIEKYYPTLLIDEADTFIKNDPSLRGALNSGHERSQARILRTVGDDHEPRQFSTWAPKAIALIGRMHPTLEDRSIRIELRRKLPTEHIERLPRETNTFLDLRRKLARWAEDNIPQLRKATPKTPKELHDRARDNWDALFAIADLCGETWPDRARKAAVELSGEDDDQTHLILLLQDLRDLFEKSGTGKLSSQEIVDALCGMEHRPWGEFRNGHPITAHAVAKLLADLKIRPKQIRIRGRRTQGYDRRQFEAAFTRYVPRTGQASSDTSDNAETSRASTHEEPLTRVRLRQGRDGG